MIMTFINTSRMIHVHWELCRQMESALQFHKAFDGVAIQLTEKREDEIKHLLVYSICLEQLYSVEYCFWFQPTHSHWWDGILAELRWDTDAGLR